MAYGGKQFVICITILWFCKYSASHQCCLSTVVMILWAYSSINLPVPLLTYCDWASPILKPIEYHLFDGKSQYLSIFEVTWRHPKFWTLPLAHGGNRYIQTVTAIYWHWGESSYSQQSWKSWCKALGHWGPWESCIQAKNSPTESRWPNKGPCTSALKLNPLE